MALESQIELRAITGGGILLREVKVVTLKLIVFLEAHGRGSEKG